jgi:hypothetical protein
MRTGRIVGGLTSGVFLLAFAAFWATLTVGFDVRCARAVIRQIDARDFPTAQGTVTASALTPVTRKGRRTEYADISYRYTVDGREHTGTRIRHGTERGDRLAREFVAGHRVGSVVKVYYDPMDPADALLLPGIYGTDLFMPLFLLPFNAVMLGLAVGAVAVLRGAFRAPRLDLIPVPGGTRVRLPAVRPVLAAAVAAAAAAFVLVFVVGFSTGMNPSVGTMAAAWAAVIVFAGWAWAWAAGALRRGAYDLDVNDLRRTVTLPLAKKRVERQVVAFDDCERVDVYERVTTPSKGDTVKHAVRLTLRRDVDGRRDVDLAEYTDAEDARMLRNWLSEQIEGGGGTSRRPPATAAVSGAGRTGRGGT